MAIVLTFIGQVVLYGQAPTTEQMINLTLSPVCLLSIAGSQSQVDLELSAPLSSGGSIVPVTNNSDLWLNYTSAIALSSPPRQISAQVDLLIPGIDLKVEAKPFSGIGKGQMGISSGPVVLGVNPGVILSGIRGAYTGIGINNGHQLVFSVAIRDYSKLVKTANKTITITYTISDQ